MNAGIFVPKTIRSLEHSFPRRNTADLSGLSLLGPFVPWSVNSLKFCSRYPSWTFPAADHSFTCRNYSESYRKVKWSNWRAFGRSSTGLRSRQIPLTIYMLQHWPLSCITTDPLSREQMFQGTNGPGNESSRERTVQGTNVPGNEWSWERKFHHENECTRERI